MTGKPKDDLLKTFLAIVLMAAGTRGVHTGGEMNAVMGAVCFLIGFIIMTALYGQKWLWWASDLFR